MESICHTLLLPCPKQWQQKTMIFEQKESINEKGLEDVLFLRYLWMHNFSICHKNQRYENSCRLRPSCCSPSRITYRRWTGKTGINQRYHLHPLGEAPKFILVLKSYLKSYSLILKANCNILREMSSLIKCGARLGEELTQTS